MNESVDYPSGKNNEMEAEVVLPAEKKRKIRDKLRNFFVRRPTQESLREKGILLGKYSTIIQNYILYSTITFAMP